MLWEGEMEWLMQTCSLALGAGPAPWKMVVVSLMLRSPGKVADTPFLGLTQGEMGGGRPGPSRPQGWQSLFFPFGIPRAYGSY